MKKAISIIERIILESLARKPKQLDGLAIDSGLRRNIVFNSLSYLLTKNLVESFNGVYFINKNIDWKQTVNRPESVEYETKELLCGLVKQHLNPMSNHSSTLAVKKAWMSDTDYSIFQSMLINIDQFIQNLPKMQSPQPLKKQRIIFWGHSNYADLADTILN